MFAASLSRIRTVGDNVVWTDERTQSGYTASVRTRIIPHYHPEIQGETSLQTLIDFNSVDIKSFP